MAAVVDLSNVDYSSKKGRFLMNKLRDSGQEYISNKGKLVPAKIQPSTFCMCPQQCTKKLNPIQKWKNLFEQFYALADQSMQNKFLQSHIEVKQIYPRTSYSGKSVVPASKRRVTCKYYVPELPEGGGIEDCIQKRCQNVIQVCQRAFMSIYAITEKRLRMQREKNIAILEFDLTTNIPDRPAPLDLTRPFMKPTKGSEQPLDLSNPVEKSINALEIDKSKLYELAARMGVPKHTVDREMAGKFEELVKKNIRKHQQKFGKCKKMKCDGENNGGLLKGITEQVVGLTDELAILPIQTLNNGDLTITPVLSREMQPVENQEIMQVNYFFQNQLWKPEYLGIPPKKSPIKSRNVPAE